MLSQSELATLQTIISEDNKTFDDLKLSFEAAFNKNDFFKIGLTLSLLIKDRQLNLYQEISAFYILFIMSFPDKDSTPFNSLALSVLKETKIKKKQKFLKDFLENKITYTDIKIKDFIEPLENIEIYCPSELIDYEENERAGGEEISKIKEIGKEGRKGPPLINPVIIEKKITDNSGRKNSEIDLSQLTTEETSFRYFESNYMSFYPGLFNNNRNKIFTNEPCWLLPMLNHKYIWENSTYDKISTLLNQILNNIPLSKDESKFIISAVEKNPSLIKNINFIPRQMMLLIEKDEPLASDILLIICKTSLNE